MDRKWIGIIEVIGIVAGTWTVIRIVIETEDEKEIMVGVWV
jgi:hypothetical protein